MYYPSPQKKNETDVLTRSPRHAQNRPAHFSTTCRSFAVTIIIIDTISIIITRTENNRHSLPFLRTAWVSVFIQPSNIVCPFRSCKVKPYTLSLITAIIKCRKERARQRCTKPQRHCAMCISVVKSIVIANNYWRCSGGGGGDDQASDQLCRTTLPGAPYLTTGYFVFRGTYLLRWADPCARNWHLKWELFSIKLW